MSGAPLVEFVSPLNTVWRTAFPPNRLISTCFLGPRLMCSSAIRIFSGLCRAFEATV